LFIEAEVKEVFENGVLVSIKENAVSTPLSESFPGQVLVQLEEPVKIEGSGLLITVSPTTIGDHFYILTDDGIKGEEALPFNSIDAVWMGKRTRSSSWRLGKKVTCSTFMRGVQNENKLFSFIGFFNNGLAAFGFRLPDLSWRLRFKPVLQL
jgi:hypothetical protein